mmetsp:Transcript_97441/g.244246  ORF Transcript_97441/g.244246 Transcript_97441/m.244246 type:complete len:289 (-) Transcript_97441:294-1160(-)
MVWFQIYSDNRTGVFAQNTLQLPKRSMASESKPRQSSVRPTDGWQIEGLAGRSSPRCGSGGAAAGWAAWQLRRVGSALRCVPRMESEVRLLHKSILVIISLAKGLDLGPQAPELTTGLRHDVKLLLDVDALLVQAEGAPCLFFLLFLEPLMDVLCNVTPERQLLPVDIVNNTHEPLPLVQGNLLSQHILALLKTRLVASTRPQGVTPLLCITQHFNASSVDLPRLGQKHAFLCCPSGTATTKATKETRCGACEALIHRCRILRYSCKPTRGVHPSGIATRLTTASYRR